MWLVVVVSSEALDIVESWIVALEGLEESFDLALRGRFSSGTEDMLDSLLGAEGIGRHPNIHRIDEPPYEGDDFREFIHLRHIVTMPRYRRRFPWTVRVASILHGA